MLPIIEIRNLSKRYQLGKAFRRTETLRELLERKARPPWDALRGQKNSNRGLPARHWFWALHAIDFDVQQGEVLGIVGRNGAGKSTLLKIMSRITEPTEGHIKIRGRLASLLEVGTG